LPRAYDQRVTADLFISYAHTSDEHQQWVRLLAAHLKAVGFDVLIDADVDYGDSLTGFMQRVTDCRHALMVVDENYVERADSIPGSGVAIENGWLQQASHAGKPIAWLSVLFKDNHGGRLPEWLAAENPKGHWFNTNPGRGIFPGSEQVEDLWRWMEGLPANRDHATKIGVLRRRSTQLERIDRERDPASWSSPAVEGQVEFAYERSPGQTFRLGCGEFSFALQVAQHGEQSVYVLKDPIHAVGLNHSGTRHLEDLALQLTPGRYVIAHVGQQVILQNSQGALCVVDLLAVQREVTDADYKPAAIQFRYRILVDS